MSCQFEPAVWSRDTGQRIPFLTGVITWMSNTKEVQVNQGCMPLCQPVIWSIAAMLRDSLVVVVRTRPRPIPLAVITMKKSTHGFTYIHTYFIWSRRLIKLAAVG